MKRVYVAAPFADAKVVRELHWQLRTAGAVPTSSWASGAHDTEDFASYTVPELQAFAAKNDRDLRTSDAVIVLARVGAGGEMFAEARMAILLGIPVYWVGRRTLSAWRAGVVRCENVDEAIERVMGAT